MKMKFITKIVPPLHHISTNHQEPEHHSEPAHSDNPFEDPEPVHQAPKPIRMKKKKYYDIFILFIF